MEQGEMDVVRKSDGIKGKREREGGREREREIDRWKTAVAEISTHSEPFTPVLSWLKKQEHTPALFCLSSRCFMFIQDVTYLPVLKQTYDGN